MRTVVRLKNLSIARTLHVRTLQARSTKMCRRCLDTPHGNSSKTPLVLQSYNSIDFVVIVEVLSTSVGTGFQRAVRDEDVVGDIWRLSNAPSVMSLDVVM
jgi:hypothetical protein